MNEVKTHRLPPRLKYTQLAPEGMEALRALEHYLNTGAGLSAVLQGFVRLLASEINGCAYCINLHAAELRRLNETEARIAGVKNWRTVDVFTQTERAALSWTEAVTNIQDGHAPQAVYDEVRAHFSETEVVNLTLTITTINAWNRLAISLGSPSSHG